MRKILAVHLGIIALTLGAIAFGGPPVVWGPSSTVKALPSGGLQMPGSTSGTFTQKSAASTTSYTVTWPSAQASGTQVLQNNGSGTLSWASPAGFSIGSLDSQAENANGLDLTSTVLSAQSADTTHPGMVNNALQSMGGGLKKFTNDASLVGFRDTSDSNITLSNTNPRHIVYTGFTTNRNVTLPTTNVLAGEIFMLANTSAHDMTVKSSDTSTVTIIQDGYTLLMALGNTPTAQSDWLIIDENEVYVLSTTFQSDGSGSAATSSINLTFSRSMHKIGVSFPVGNAIANCGTSAQYFKATTSVPQRFRPGSTGRAFLGQAPGYNSGAGLSTPSTVEMRSDTGTLELERDNIGTGWGTGNCGYNPVRNDSVNFTWQND